MPSPAKSVAATEPWPSPARGWIVVVLLMLASMVSQFDRTVVNLMIEPLKQTFSLDDTHFGMLQGVAFGIFYTLACFPIGRLSDRYQRRLVIATALGFFSLFAMGSGLARTYTQLFLTRIGVGVGEASLTPAGLSLSTKSRLSSRPLVWLYGAALLAVTIPAMLIRNGSS